MSNTERGTPNGGAVCIGQRASHQKRYFLFMGRIVAIGGGSFKSTELVNRYALDLTKKENPNVLFIPTAHRDDNKYIAEFTEAFEALGAKVSTLTLIKKEYTEAQIDSLLDSADFIYVGGGNAVYMMNVWKKFGLDVKLKNIYKSDGAVLAGNGSGALCWFCCGYSNSHYNGGETDWQYIWADNMLDFHHTAVCPHYNDDGRSNFDIRLMEKEIPGYGLEDNVALIQIGEHTEFVASHPKARAFYLIYLNGELVKKEINLIYL